MTPNNQPTPRPSRILVADDEHLIASSISASLKSLGYEVVGPVGDGAAALELFENDPPPDLALLDIRMPTMDGLEVARRLWHERGVPSIIISAYSGEDHFTRAQHAGVFGYLIKPVSADSLGAEISVVWAKYCNHSESTRRIHQLETSLQDRRLVEQAKWRLVQVNSLTEAQAHAAMQKAARNQRRKLRDVAQFIIDCDKKPIPLD